MGALLNLLGVDSNLGTIATKQEGKGILDEAVSEPEFKGLLSSVFNNENIEESINSLVDEVGSESESLLLNPELSEFLPVNPLQQLVSKNNNAEYKYDELSLDDAVKKIAVSLDMPDIKFDLKAYAKELAASKDVDPNELLVNLKELATLNPEAVKNELLSNPKSDFLWKLPVVENNTADFTKQEILTEFTDVKGKVVQVKEDVNISTAKTTQTLLESGQAVNVKVNVDNSDERQMEENLDDEAFSEELPSTNSKDEKEVSEKNPETKDTIESKDFKDNETFNLHTPINNNDKRDDIRIQDSNLKPINQQVSDGIKDSKVFQTLEAGGSDKISIQLHPESLGKVEVKLDMMKDGSIKALILAEKPEALNALKMEVSSLQESLNNMGFSSGSNAFEFQHQDHNKNRSMSEGVKLAAMEESAEEVSSAIYQSTSKNMANHNGALNLIA